MAKTKISEFSSTPANNTDIDSINIAEGCAPSGINDAIRELMAQLKDFQTGAQGDSFNGPVGTTTAAAGAFTTLSATGNVTLGDASTDTLNVGNGGLIKDSSGNLGLGVTPSAWGSGSTAFQLGNGGIWKSGSRSVDWIVNGYYNGANYIYNQTAAATYYRQYDGQHLWFNAPSGTAGNAITFTQAMTLEASGNLLVGATSNLAGERLTLTGSVANYVSRAINSNANPNGLAISYSTATPNGTGNEFFGCFDNTTARLYVRSNGGIANYSANNVNLSDRREKTNFAPAKSYLDVICAIPVQTYNYIDQNIEEDGGLTLGVVAQDVQAVAPELVTESDWSEEKDGSKMRLSIYQTDMQYALMKALQELKAEFDAYKASHP